MSSSTGGQHENDPHQGGQYVDVNMKVLDDQHGGQLHIFNMRLANI